MGTNSPNGANPLVIPVLSKQILGDFLLQCWLRAHVNSFTQNMCFGGTQCAWHCPEHSGCSCEQNIQLSALLMLQGREYNSKEANATCGAKATHQAGKRIVMAVL